MIFLQLFYVFFMIGLFTFGGGYAMIPMIQEQVVARGWISEKTLGDFIAISESTPGPYAINIATFVGSQKAGILGAICATTGVVLPSFVIILIVAMIITKFLNNRYVKGALNRVRPVVIALILATALMFAYKFIFSIQGNMNIKEARFDRKGTTILALLIFVYFGYGKIKRKPLSPISLLGFSALFGLIFYGIM